MSQVKLVQESLHERDIILSVKNLSVTFKDGGKEVKAVKDVSFDIYTSEILSVVGESGSGKTTLARCVVGLVRPTSGSIIYGGVDMTSRRTTPVKSYLRDVQMIFQDPFESLNPRQDVFTFVSAPLRYLLGEKVQERLAKAVSATLREVGLTEDIMWRYPHQLSGGQRQRIGIARALISNPKLLIADEPITMLDATQRLNVISMLKSLKERRNLSVLIITHDLASAKLLSDRTVVMFGGKLVEMGPTDYVVDRPHHPYTQLIIESMPGSRPLVQNGSANTHDSTTTPSSGCIFRPHCQYATGVCEEKDPELTPKSSNHYASCHNPLNP